MCRAETSEVHYSMPGRFVGRARRHADAKWCRFARTAYLIWPISLAAPLALFDSRSSASRPPAA
jgi:hypothetical protein